LLTDKFRPLTTANERAHFHTCWSFNNKPAISLALAYIAEQNAS